MLHSRMERVQSLIKAEVARIIDQDLNDPTLPNFITVSDADVSKDFSNAVIHITFLQDQTEEAIAATVAELNHSAGYIGHLLSQRVTLRRHPHLKFVYNPSTNYALGMENIFQEIKREEPPQDPQTDSPSDPSNEGDETE